MNTHPHSHFGSLTSQTTTRMLVSLVLTAIFVVVEIAAGLWGNSLALLTDAAHNFTDVISLGLSWYALKVAAKPSNAGKTFGYHRVGILTALVNSTTLVLIACGIFYEAYQRFVTPSEVNSSILIGVGFIAFLINASTAWLVHKGSEHDLNLRSAFLHLMGDVLSTLGAVIAGVIIYFTGWNWLDPLVSVLIAFVIIYSAAGVLRQSIHILLEGTPENIDMPKLIKDIRTLKGIRDVHDLHVWSVAENLRMLSAHIVIDDLLISQAAIIQNDVNELLSHHYDIQHVNLQLECGQCSSANLFCEIHQHSHGSEAV